MWLICSIYHFGGSPFDPEINGLTKMISADLKDYQNAVARLIWIICDWDATIHLHDAVICFYNQRTPKRKKHEIHSRSLLFPDE